MKKILKSILAFLILCVITISSAWAQNTDPFTVIFDELTPIKVTPDGQATIPFQVTVPEKHHLYREAMHATVDRPVLHQEFITPAGVVKHDDFMGKDAELYEAGDYTMTLKVTVPPDFDFTQAFTGTIIYQGCSDKICFRAIKKPFKFVLYHPSVGANLSSGQSSAPNTPSGMFDLLHAADFKDVLNRGLPLALLVTFLAGLVTAFTPCVLPVIPLTLAFMGVSINRSRAERASALALFVLGLCLMYASLGVGSALIGRTLGFQFQSPAFLAALVIIFLVMGLWMLGIINLNMPASLQNAIMSVQPKGALRNLYAGLTIGFLAAPCVGPVVGPLLVYISSTKDALLGFALMMSYALGLSVLFILLSFFSRDWIARFGVKSLWVKRVLGVLILATAGFYLSALSAPLWQQEAQGANGAFFMTDFVKAEAKAKASNKGLMIDFYADWCVPCREWDQGVWRKPEVQKALAEKFVPVKINCTQETEACDTAVVRYDVLGWPTIIFTDPSGHELPGKRIVGQVMSAEAFLKYVGKIR